MVSKSIPTPSIFLQPLFILSPNLSLLSAELRQAVMVNDYTKLMLALKAPNLKYDLEQPDNCGVTLVMIAAQHGQLIGKSGNTVLLCYDMVVGMHGQLRVVDYDKNLAWQYKF